jgi:hypothetical protein
MRLDLAFLAQDTIAELGEEFGAVGPLAFLAILLEAKTAAFGGIPPGQQGTVKVRYRALARLACTDAETARRVVARCAELGLLTVNGDSEQFTCRLLKWSSWEPIDSGAKVRKQNQRNRSKAEEPASAKPPGAPF